MSRRPAILRAAAVLGVVMVPSPLFSLMAWRGVADQVPPPAPGSAPAK